MNDDGVRWWGMGIPWPRQYPTSLVTLPARCSLAWARAERRDTTGAFMGTALLMLNGVAAGGLR